MLSRSIFPAKTVNQQRYLMNTVSSLQVTTAQPDSDVHIPTGGVAGRKLLAICTNIAPNGSRDLTPFEEAMLDESCAAGAGAGGRETFTRSRCLSSKV